MASIMGAMKTSSDRNSWRVGSESNGTPAPHPSAADPHPSGRPVASLRFQSASSIAAFTNCDAIVAQAAPAGPMPIGPTSTKSPMRLIRATAGSARSGDVASLDARKAACSTMVVSAAGYPKALIAVYWAAGPMEAADPAPIIFVISGNAATRRPPVIRTPSTSAMVSDPPTMRCACAGRRPAKASAARLVVAAPMADAK
mmetsp:Transcript_10281/g.22346  ORF Transcript_10281/g.22346 Transcript_10281/m.22346 type:complete len:200 (+) Transcript_10281:1156-1755(+)